MARLHDVVFDSEHPAKLAQFWAAALDGYDVARYGDAELARLAAMGVYDPDDDPTVLVESPDATPRFWFQKVSEPKVVKNRLHLDLRSEDPHTEASRLIMLGATVVGEQPNDSLIVMLDPEGNEFCLLK